MEKQTWRRARDRPPLSDLAKGSILTKIIQKTLLANSN